MSGRSARPPAARKRFGQHFLERAWADKIVEAIAPHNEDVFLEIGPGRGAITRPLAARSRRVLAVEIDRDLAARLAGEGLPGVTVLPADFLSLSRTSIERALASAGTTLHDVLRVAGNLPYNVASPILFRLCDLHREGLPLADATLMLQREVADRLTAVPGTRDYGVLSVLIPLVAPVERVLELPPGAFRPPPKVRSSVIRLRFHAPDPAPANLDVFTSVVRDVFTRRRKTLSNALLGHRGFDPAAAGRVLAIAAIDGRRRPETLTLHEFVRLADAVVSDRRDAHAARAGPVV